MRKMTMPNFCINFLNKAAKSLPILYDFAVASLVDAWIKIGRRSPGSCPLCVASLVDAWIKIVANTKMVRYKVASLAVRGLKPDTVP